MAGGRNLARFHDAALLQYNVRVKRLPCTGLFLLVVVAGCASGNGERAANPPSRSGSTSPPPSSSAPVVDGAALLTQAESARAAGDAPRTRALLRQAQDDPATKARAQLLLAELLFAEDGDAQSAAPLADAAAQAQPTDTAALLLAGRIQEALGQRALARAHYENAAKANPTLVDAHERLGSLALADLSEAQAAKNTEAVKDAALRALSAFKEARTLAGDKLHYALGESQALEATGDAQGAEAALKRMLALSPDAPGPHMMLAAFYERRGDKAKAAAERKKAGQAPEPPKRNLRPLKPSR